MKLFIEKSDKWEELTFNWTKVELKLFISPKMGMILFAFNWTKVELKPYPSKCKVSASCLLIELR